MSCQENTPPENMFQTTYKKDTPFQICHNPQNTALIISGSGSGIRFIVKEATILSD